MSIFGLQLSVVILSVLCLSLVMVPLWLGRGSRSFFEPERQSMPTEQQVRDGEEKRQMLDRKVNPSLDASSLAAAYQSTMASASVPHSPDSPGGRSERAELRSFAYWYQVLAERREPRCLIRSPRWMIEPRAAYLSDFLAFCDHEAEKVQEEEAAFASEEVLYFDDSALMPLLWERGFHIRKLHGRSLFDLIREADAFTLLLLSVKDDGSQAFNHKWQEKLTELAVRLPTREHLRHSYLNVIWKKNAHTYVNVFEEVAAMPLRRYWEAGEDLGGLTLPASIEVYSAGALCGNGSSIRIDGQEYSPNERGINLVVYDLIEQRVLRTHRVDAFVTIYEDLTIYRASREEPSN